MSSWVEDHLTCAALSRWLPTWSSAHATRLVVRGRPPGRLAALLATLEAAPSTSFGQLVVVAALSDRSDAVTVELGARAVEDASSDGVQVIDVAWLVSWRARAGLWGWRREPVRAAMAHRLGRLADAGLGALQQWVCLTPVPCVVTLGALPPR